jgi:hypothetical protein
VDPTIPCDLLYLSGLLCRLRLAKIDRLIRLPYAKIKV